MATASAHRVLLLIPAARQAAISAWWTANIDGADGGLTWNVGLSATGSGAPSHYWTSCALTDAQCVAVLRQLASMATLPVPTAGSLATKAQKTAWLTTNGPALLATLGIRVVRDDNDAPGWSPPDDLLAAAGLQRIGAAA